MKKNTIIAICAAIAFVVLFVLVSNLIAILKVKGDIVTDLSKAQKVDAIVVLGFGAEKDAPNEVSVARLDKAIELYSRRVASTIVVAAGETTDKVDETRIMKNYLIGKGIPESAIRVSYGGHSTYDLLKKVHDDFKYDSIFIASQKYHLYRSLYIADKLGMDSYGAIADNAGISFTTKVREIFARAKDVVKTVF